jgi:hypothetical protein
MKLTLGLLNGPCNLPIDVSFTLLNASLDGSDVISPAPNGQANVMAPLAADGDGNGLPDGADKYPVFLRNALDPDWDIGPDGLANTQDDLSGGTPPTMPIQRLAGLTKMFGQWISVQIVTFAPGALLPVGGDRITFKPDLGFPTLVVLQDPTGANAAGPISDICSPLRYDFGAFGQTWDNPCTGVIDTAATRGNCPSEFDFALENLGYPLFPCDQNNSLDEDSDGVVNDGCPQVNAQPETGQGCVNTTSDDQEDSSVNDGCPQLGDVSEGGYIGGSCSGNDEGGCVIRTNPADARSYDFVTAAVSARDADSDGRDNVADSCPLQPDTGTDPDSDGLPSVCDPSPQTPSPQSPLSGGAPCFETGIVGHDDDQDCYSNRQDNCPLVPNRGQQDVDGDAIGDACDPNPGLPNGSRASSCMVFGLTVGVGADPRAFGPVFDTGSTCQAASGIPSAPGSGGSPTPTPSGSGGGTGGGPASPTPTATPNGCILDDNDFDNDGRKNRRDKDDDNDGVRDGRDRDDDNDGIRDRRDSDDDNDGIPDRKDRNHGKLYCPDEEDADDDDD